MVSITFDEFHALRSRQRAKAQAPSIVSSPGTTSRTSTFSKLGTNNGEDTSRQRDGLSRAPIAISGTVSAHLRPTAYRLSLLDANIIFGTATVPRKSKNCPPTTGEQGREDETEMERQEMKTSDSTEISGILVGSRLGLFVETYEVQLLVVVLIYLDLVISTVQLLPTFSTSGSGERGVGGGGEHDEGSFSFEHSLLHLAMRIIRLFTGFTTFFFVIEVSLLMVAFRGKFFTHIGYLTDALIVAACLGHEIGGMGRGVRLLGVVRVWRVARLLNTLLDSAEGRHQDTKEALKLEQQLVQELELEGTRLRETLKREVEARGRMGNMLKGYKDEVQ
ncbi:unnamed protein product, partial [Discosporangium mesarthrocarpum]